MILSMSGQAALFLLTVLVGFCIGFVYDVFRIFRKSFRHPSFLIQLEDVVFWLFVTFAAFYVMLYQNQGEIRFFHFLGFLLGTTLYFLTLSGLVIGVSVAVIGFLKRVVMTALAILLFPVKLLVRLLRIPFRMVARPVKKALRKSGKYAKMKGGQLRRDLKIICKKV